METVLAHLGPRQACGLVLGKPAAWSSASLRNRSLPYFSMQTATSN